MHPEQKKIYVTETTASAARSASGGRAGGCGKNSKATLAMPLGRVTILVSLPYDRTAKFRGDFLTAPEFKTLLALAIIALTSPEWLMK